MENEEVLFVYCLPSVGNSTFYGVGNKSLLKSDDYRDYENLLISVPYRPNFPQTVLHFTTRERKELSYLTEPSLIQINPTSLLLYVYLCVCISVSVSLTGVAGRRHACLTLPALHHVSNL